jgi:hypothetical protein
MSRFRSDVGVRVAGSVTGTHRISSSGLPGHVELLPAADEQVGVRHALHERNGPFRPARGDLLDVLLGNDRREGEVGEERRRRLLEGANAVVVDTSAARGRG